MASLHEPRLMVPVSQDDRSQGPANASLTLVEYGDYECPHCGAAHPVVKEVQRRLGSDLRFVFRDFPLARAHVHAQQAAEAANAAAAQGKFWEMHDLLFEHQDALETADLVRYAGELGMDVARFERELTEQTHRAAVRESFLAGARSGVNGTPTFFINGSRFEGPKTVDGLIEALNQAR